VLENNSRSFLYFGDRKGTPNRIRVGVRPESRLLPVMGSTVAFPMSTDTFNPVLGRNVDVTVAELAPDCS